MRDNNYIVYLKPEEFHWLWEDVELSLYSAQKKSFLKNKFGQFDDLTDYGAVKLLKRLRAAFKKSDKEHVCVDEAKLI